MSFVTKALTIRRRRLIWRASCASPEAILTSTGLGTVYARWISSPATAATTPASSWFKSKQAAGTTVLMSIWVLIAQAWDNRTNTWSKLSSRTLKRTNHLKCKSDKRTWWGWSVSRTISATTSSSPLMIDVMLLSYREKTGLRSISRSMTTCATNSSGVSLRNEWRTKSLLSTTLAPFSPI